MKNVNRGVGGGGAVFTPGVLTRPACAEPWTEPFANLAQLLEREKNQSGGYDSRWRVCNGELGPNGVLFYFFSFLLSPDN